MNGLSQGRSAVDFGLRQQPAVTDSVVNDDNTASHDGDFSSIQARYLAAAVLAATTTA